MQHLFLATTSPNRNRKTMTAVAAALLALFTATVQAAEFADTDQDRVVDIIDNCTKTSNPLQTDGDNDGFGNACDADLNNDGKVTQADEGLFLQQQKNYAAGKPYNPAADFDANGKVEDSDYKILLAAIKAGLVPGPTAVLPDNRFANQAPLVEKLVLYQVDGSSLASEQAAVTVRFSAEAKVGSTLVATPIDKPLVLNDIGIAPDAKAGDGIHSAFINIDFKRRDEDINAYLKRVGGLKEPMVLKFASRAITGKTLFVAPTGTNIEDKITLADGRLLVPFDPGLDVTPLAATTSPTKTVGINDLSVVKDLSRTFNPCQDGNFTTTTAADGNVNGVWSFKTLMKNMSSPTPTDATARVFIHNWLRQWRVNQTVNGFTIAARPSIINFFPGWDGTNASTLNIDKLPFRLLAIMNRIDLAKSTAYGRNQAGEIRFVFGLVKPTAPSLCTPQQMTVILEYGDGNNSCPTLKTRAQQWQALDALPVPSASYNSVLQLLTDTVTTANIAPGKVNGSAINQIRTNDFAFAPPTWQLREFTFPSTTSSLLASATIKQTPHKPWHFQTMPSNNLLWQWPGGTVPLTWNFPPIKPVLAASVDYLSNDFWTKPFVASPTTIQQMHEKSFNTCNACHARETNTFFTHVSPVTTPAAFAGFLTGNTVVDPRVSTVSRSFNDFARRGQILDSLAAQSCAAINLQGALLPKLDFVH
jgi:hypothetical protein